MHRYLKNRQQCCPKKFVRRPLKDFPKSNMSAYTASLQRSSFTCRKYVSFCTDNTATIAGLKPFNHLASIHGGPYLFAAAADDLLFTVVAGETSPFTSNFVLVYQMSTGTFQKSIEFDTDILAICASDAYLFVSMAGSIQILEIESFNVVNTVQRTSSTGLIAACPGFLAYACDDPVGLVTIVAIPGFSMLQQISCHQDPIQCISLSSDGKLLTTASDKGTLIRVFDVQDGNKSSEFRRGFRASAVTAVDTDNDITCACTATTLHVFTRAHITSPLSHPPLALNVIDGDVWLVTTDGILTIYKVDRAGAKLVLQNQQKLSELSITDESKKLKRRTTI